jgi:hypothetical protein
MRANSFCSVLLVGGLCLPVVAQVEIRQPRQRKTDDKNIADTPEKKKEKAANEQLAKDLLTRASGMSKQLSDSDRAFLLAKLAQASTKTMPEQSKAWADEVFQVTSGLPADAQRSQNEITAMMAMTENDPDKGLQMLSKMEAPAPRSDGRPVPDMRAGAAGMLFQKYFQKRGSEGIEALQAAARQLGESGNYPYMAMGPIIRQITRKDSEKAQSLTNEALSFFSRRARSDQSAQQVSTFLRMNRDLIPAPILKDILGQLVSDALNTKDTNSNTSMFVSTSRGTATMSGATNLVLFQLLPMIREIDPEWAKKVESQSTELRAAASLNDNSAGNRGPTQERMGVMVGAPGSGPLPMANMMEEMKSREVDELVKQDPKEAMKVAAEIHDPVIRAATDARLAGEVNKSDPDQAAQMIKSAREAMAATKEPADKLRILVGLAQAQSAMKDKEGFSITLDQAYAMGEDLYRKSVDKTPDGPIMGRAGYDSMTRLTMTGVKLDSSATLAHIEGIRMPILQAMLLVAAAQGLDPDGAPQDGMFRIQIRS